MIISGRLLELAHEIVAGKATKAKAKVKAVKMDEDNTKPLYSSCAN